MLYAINMVEHSVLVIDSKTLQMRWVKFPKLFKMYCEGTDILNIRSVAMLSGESSHIGLYSRKLVSQYAGFESSYHTGVFGQVIADKRMNIPLVMCRNMMLQDFEVELKDAMIHYSGDKKLHIWHNDCHYSFDMLDMIDNSLLYRVYGFYLSSKGLMWVETVIGHNERYIKYSKLGEIDTLKGIKVEGRCSKSGFKRGLLFT